MSHPIKDMTVLLWDANSERLQMVARTIPTCGAKCAEIKDVSQVVDAACSFRQCVALVALENSKAQSTESLKVIQSLKLKGFKIISYAPGIFSWDIALRCNALLSGASLLLDSSSPTFSNELRHVLIGVLNAAAEEYLEVKDIKNWMSDLQIVGESSELMSVFRWVVRVSTLSDFAVLISGETGTGKELIANALHKLDRKRSSGPFIAANCGAISAGIAESEFFGHRRGAFTGAISERKGLFRSAQGGVLFLDEIGELSESLQAKLLRVLQEKRVLGVGFDQEVSVDVRIVAATNRSLEDMVRVGRFRADLFHRLNVLSINIPPLRERYADLRPLIVHFLNKYSSLNCNRTTSVNSDFVDALMRVELPGNARQLENIVRAAILNKTDESPLSLCDLTPTLWRQIYDNVAQSAPGTDAGILNKTIGETSGSEPRDIFRDILEENSWNLPRSLDQCEKLLLQYVLQSSRGNKSQAARLIGLTPRTVYNKLHKHNLNR